MKLRNKKTGEIGYLHSDSNNSVQVARNSGYNYRYYDTLTELIAEWEDVPESKEYWYIDIDGEVNSGDTENDIVKDMRAIGNYFESEEEAKKAVKKLKAFKRLKDKGFRFNGYSHYDWNGNKSPAIAFEYPDFDEMFDDKQVVADLDICFGGEE